MNNNQISKLTKIGLLTGLLVLSFSMTGCSQVSSFSQSQEMEEESAAAERASANQLLAKARAPMKAGEYVTAIKHFENLEARYPLGRHAQQALLETAYAYYKAEEEDTALDTIDRFIRMYPRSPIMDYALYLRGLVNFNRGKSIVDKFFPRSFADLDNVRQKESFHDFSKLVTRFPSSKYAPDAKMRILHLRNNLAKSEISVAEYYMKRGAYLAAFNRAEYTIKHYEGSPAVIDALAIKIRASEKMGKPGIAAATRRVLKLNFPKQAAKMGYQKNNLNP